MPGQTLDRGPREQKLTAKQKRFAAIYARQPHGQKNLKQAALQAGYAESGCNVRGSVLIRDPRIRAEILRLDPQDESIPNTTGIDADWLLYELAQLWHADVAELLDDDGRLRPLKEIPEEARKLIAGFEITRRTASRPGDDDEIELGIETGKVKLIDRLRVLESIGKHIQVNAFNERRDSETDKSLAKLLDAATEAIQAQAPDRAIDVSPNTGDPYDDR